MKKILLLINLLLLLQTNAYAHEPNKPCKYKDVLEKRKQMHAKREMQTKQAHKEWRENGKQIQQDWIKKKKQMHDKWQDEKRQIHKEWIQGRKNSY